MSQFRDLNGQLVANIERAMQITEINNMIIDHSVEAIKSLGTIRNPKTGANATNNQVLAIQQLRGNPKVSEVLAIVYGQQIVLFVSAFEAYLRDIVRTLANERPELIDWPDGSKGAIELSTLSRGGLTVGDIILSIIEQRGITFQDLQAIKRFFKDYLKKDLIIDSIFEQNYILATAIRHATIHLQGVVDEKFLKQIKNLPSDVREQYKINKPISIEEDFVLELRDSFLELGQSVQQIMEEAVRERSEI